MPVSAVDAIHPAFQQLKNQLFRPFRFGQWIRLAVVGMLAGEMGGNGCNANFSMPSGTQQPTGSGPSIRTAFATQSPHWPHFDTTLIVTLVVACIVISILFVYISSVMRFILFDSIVTRECRIRAGWRRHSRETKHGIRLFAWELAYMFVSLAALAVFIGIPVGAAFLFGWFEHPRNHLVGLILGGIFLLFLFLLLFAAMAVVQVMTKDFVVPQMALENINAMEAWRRLWASLKTEKLGYTGYVGMKIVLAMGFAVALGIITLIFVLMLLIPVGGIGALVVLAGKAAGLTWNASTIALAIICGLILAAAFLFISALISVPSIVFFPAYSIYFFAPRYGPLASLLWPQMAPAGRAISPPPSPPQV